MRQQDAGAASIQSSALQQRFEKFRIFRLSIVNSDDLQSVDFHLFIIQDADAGSFRRLKEFCAVIEFFVIAADIINPCGSGKSLSTVRGARAGPPLLRRTYRRR